MVTVELFVEFVLLSIDIILQEDLDLVVHLMANVVTEEDRDDQDDTEAYCSQGDGSVGTLAGLIIRLE